MKNFKKLILRTILLALDIAALCGSYAYVWVKFYNPYIRHLLFRGTYLLVLVYALILILCIVFMKGHQIGIARISENAVAQAIAAFITSFVLYFPMCLLQYGFINPVPLLLLYLCQCLFILFWIWLSNYIYFHVIERQKVVLVTDNSAGAIIAGKLAGKPDRYEIIGQLEVKPGSELPRSFGDNYDALLICVEDDALRNSLVRYCFEQNIEFYLQLTLSDAIISSAANMYVVDTPIVNRTPQMYSLEYRFIKRAFDVFASACALLVFSPLLLIIALCVKLGDGGPVFFRQKRLTKDGRVFRIFKFRTMITDAEKHGERLASVNDSRITKVGRVLRKFRLDELPQFLNVLIGDMSLVGPRPESVQIAHDLEEKYPDFRYRLKVKAGITGYAQVYGNYSTHFRDKVMMDILYIEKCSILLDVQLMILTVKALFITDKTDGVVE